MMQPQSKTGVWIVGAYGAVSTCTILGALGLSKKLFSPTGMVTYGSLFEGLTLLDPKEMVFGGWDIRDGSLLETARLLSKRDGILPSDLIEEFQGTLEKIDSEILPGSVLHGGAFGKSNDFVVKAKSPLEALQKIQEDLRNFQEKYKLERVIVINLASTMSTPDFLNKMETLEEFQKALKDEQPIPPTVLYAYGALDLEMSFLNFTPSPGSELAPLKELALKKGVPHMGKDGKTGETLLKTVLAPMFSARNLDVLSWVGYNILGNMDGEALKEPESNLAKIKTKGSALKSLLPNSTLFAKVGIDYVPSLGDWKTAWDFIHFQGFMNTKMTFQFTWQGCDSMLAAPLVLDMVRLLDLSLKKGEKGIAKHLASFFKSPIEVENHHFFEQFDMLKKWIESSK